MVTELYEQTGCAQSWAIILTRGFAFGLVIFSASLFAEIFDWSKSRSVASRIVVLFMHLLHPWLLRVLLHERPFTATLFLFMPTDFLFLSHCPPLRFPTPRSFACAFRMLTHQSCYDCGCRVRLSSTIQPPRCPACRLVSLAPLLETRPCSGCRVLIPAYLSNLQCASCHVAQLALPLTPSNSPCYSYGKPFPARTRIIRCFDYRSRTSIVQPPVDFYCLYTTSFNPFVNLFTLLDPP